MGITSIEKDGKKMLRYEWQPTLEDNTPIGGLQVVEAETYDELMSKASENYNHLYRRNRELMRDKELSSKTAPEGAKRAEPLPQFQPRSLTAEERMRLARELQDPEKIDQALDLALEAKFGAKPQAVSTTVQSTAQRSSAIRAAQEAEAWRDMHSEFYASQKNCADLANWIQNRNLEFTVENFNKAYEALAPALEQAPPSSERTTSKPESATSTSRITGQDGGSEQPQPAPQVPTSVKRNMGTTHGSPKREGLTAEQFRRMTNDERKKFLRDHPHDADRLLGLTR